MIMGSVTDYVLVEPTNMQQVRDRENHRSLLPRLVKTVDDREYSSTFYLNAEMTGIEAKDGYRISVTTGLAMNKGEYLSSAKPQIEYVLTESGLKISIKQAEGLKFLLPLIDGNVEVVDGKIENKKEIFFLTGGFIAQEYMIVPNCDGNMEFIVKA